MTPELPKSNIEQTRYVDASFRWGIRSKMLLVGLFLSVLTLTLPLYVRYQIQILSECHHRIAGSRVYLMRVHELTEGLSNSETHLRAYAATGSPIWIKAVSTSLRRSHELTEKLLQSAVPIDDSQRLLKEFKADFDRWEHDIVDPTLNSPRGTESFSNVTHTLFREPIFLRIKTRLQDLERRLETQEIFNEKGFSRAARATGQIVVISGILFFVIFAVFALSIWQSVVPKLNELLYAAYEIKTGNLNYRVPRAFLSGQNETTALGIAFNEMATSLQENNEKLVALNRIKTDFVSTVSHELRTPLTAIKGSIGLLLGGVVGDFPSEAKEMLEITAKNTDRLIRLINDVLDIAKIEAGAVRLKLDRFNICEIMTGAVKAIEPFAAHHKVAIQWVEVNPAPLVVVDRDRFEQIITNLLSNSIKFSRPGTNVQMKLFLSTNQIIVHIIDQGAGITPEQVDRLFRKFQQVENVANKAKEGTGLGLAICKALVEEHGGKIGVETNLGKGSNFFFSLPWNGKDFSTDETRNSQAKAA